MPTTRVLRVIPRYAPAWSFGGGVRFSYDLDSALSRRGFAITVCTSDQLDERRRTPTLQENIGGIDIHRFRNPSNRLASRLQWLAYHPVGLRRAVRAHAERCDVVHVAEARGPHVRWAFGAARAARIPIVWSPLGGLAEGVGLRKPYRRAYDLMHRTRQMVREVDVLIAQSSHEAEVLERLGAPAARIRVIGLGVAGERFHQLPARGEFRRRLGVDPGTPLVLFIGRFHASKGLDVLLKAVAIARRTRPDIAVALVGWDHGALRTVKHVSRDLGLDAALWIVPPLFGRDAVQAYVDADVFAVAATIYEETSLAAMEAVAAGTPCVLTHQCEIPGLQEMDGGIVTECEPGAFAAGLLAVLGDRGRALQTEAARRTILSSRSTEHVAAAYASVFRELGATEAADQPHVARMAR